MSSDLVWLITRNTNSSYLKRGLYTFSTEAGNLSGKHSFKASGFANAKVGSISSHSSPQFHIDAYLISR